MRSCQTWDSRNSQLLELEKKVPEKLNIDMNLKPSKFYKTQNPSSAKEQKKKHNLLLTDRQNSNLAGNLFLRSETFKKRTLNQIKGDFFRLTTDPGPWNEVSTGSTLKDIPE